jgi:hypothetical protein
MQVHSKIIVDKNGDRKEDEPYQLLLFDTDALTG